MIFDVVTLKVVAVDNTTVDKEVHPKNSDTDPTVSPPTSTASTSSPGSPPPSSSAAASATTLPNDELCSDLSYSDAPSTVVERQKDQDLLDKLRQVENELFELRNSYREMMALKDETIKVLHDQIKEMPALILSQLHQQLMQPP